MAEEITSINYDRISKIYDTGRAAHPEATGKLVRLLGISGNSKILDMGCGTGNYARALYKTTKNIIGLDFSFGMLAQAKAKYPEILFFQGDVTDLPFESELLMGPSPSRYCTTLKKKALFKRSLSHLAKQAHLRCTPAPTNRCGVLVFSLFPQRT